ncbi:MAG: RNA polymerase sigma factor [Geminicoccaceae bacterium]|nr:RNA polymerase sigma factor [Geminicoccaceae bacterium]MCB9944831.1 RNA polymerase sigma factor [Geminicoccaceae bacterium]
MSSTERTGGIGHSDVGDLVAEEMVEHVKSLRRYATLLIGDSSDADDMVQETLTRVLARARNWRDVREVRPYLFATLHNVYIDHRRRLKRTGHPVDVDDVMSLMISPASQVKRLELRDLVQALSKLPLEQREAVLLVGLEGMSYAEAAEALSIPIGTVMSRLSRGREALRQLTDRRGISKLRVVK